MLFKDIIAVYIENRTKLINTKKNSALEIVKMAGTYKYRHALNDKGYVNRVMFNYEM
jgi:hypothetical protein